VPELIDVTPGTTTCARCAKPVIRIGDMWGHVVWADALDCIAFFGGGFITDEDEPERGGATSAWEHHHG
jgi:hypothetical protein